MESSVWIIRPVSFVIRPKVSNEIESSFDCTSGRFVTEQVSTNLSVVVDGSIRILFQLFSEFVVSTNIQQIHNQQVRNNLNSIVWFVVQI
jgi:hypothetical protein